MNKYCGKRVRLGSHAGGDFLGTITQHEHANSANGRELVNVCIHDELEVIDPLSPRMTLVSDKSWKVVEREFIWIHLDQLDFDK